jgi:hypothetical protein
MRRKIVACDPMRKKWYERGCHRDEGGWRMYDLAEPAMRQSPQIRSPLRTAKYNQPS